MQTILACFGRCRAETFRVDAQESGARRLDRAFFRKQPGVEILTSKVGGQYKLETSSKLQNTPTGLT